MAAIPRQQRQKEHPRRETTGIRHEGVTDPDRQDVTAWARPDVTRPVRCRGRVTGLAGAVPVGDVVGRVVVVVEEVPSGDVVDEPVVIRVGAVGERRVEDHVLGVAHAVSVAVRDAGILGVVDHVDGAVVIAIVVRVRLARRVLRERQLAGVEGDLRGEVGHRLGVAPTDAGVGDRRHHRRVPLRRGPRDIGPVAALAAQLVDRRRQPRISGR